MIKDTGSVMSYIRYNEQQRKDALFDDIFAKYFIDSDSLEFYHEKINLYPYFEQLMVVRHKLFIEEINRIFNNDHDITQIVSIGSGYCSIIQNLLTKNKNLIGFEVDLDEIIQKKLESKNINFLSKQISCDLITDMSKLSNELENEGFDPKKHSIVFMEGLLYYLPDMNYILRLFESLSYLMSDNSYLLFDMQIGNAEYSSDEKDFMQIFSKLSEWSNILETNNLTVAKYGNIAYLDKWNRLDSYIDKIRSGFFVVRKFNENYV